MIPIVSLLLIVGTALIVTRVAAVALEHTGLSRDAARFQARSAFTGVGFTTSEAEHVVGHPVRRRVVQWLMLVGNVGMASAMAALLVSAIDLQSREGVGVLVALLAGGILFLCFLGSNGWVDRQMCKTIRWALERFSMLEPADLAQLLHLRAEYAVSVIRVHEAHWIAGKTLADSSLPDEGLVVLGIECPGGNFIGAPGADVEIRAGDEVVLYGQAERVEELLTRPRGGEGDRLHLAAATERQTRVNEERARARR